MAEKLNFSSIVWREENLYVAWCPDLDIASQGKTIEESLANPKKVIELYLQDEEATIPKRDNSKREQQTPLRPSYTCLCLSPL